MQDTNRTVAVVDLEAEIGRLYELRPEEFVAGRDELGRRLRESGDRAAAERVRRLRRPTVAAWAVNQVARRQPDLVAELLQTGDKLRQAQRRALSGLRDSGLRPAAAERRKVLDRLVAAAGGVLAEAGRASESHQEAITATFEAASVDGEVASAVRSGTLDHELAAPAGFGEVTGLELLRPPGPPPKPAKPAKPPARRGRLDGARRRELEAARRGRDGLRRRAKESARSAAEAREAADRAQQEADGAAEAAKRLADEARQARRTADEARRAADDARREADVAMERAQRVLRRSTAALDRAGEAEAEALSARQALEEAERRITELD